MQLIDSHAHLQAEAFTGDADLVVEVARSAGVSRILVPGWDSYSSQRAVEMAARVGVDAAAGIHPHATAHEPYVGWAVVEHVAFDDDVVAVGETGLDYDREFSPRKAQLDNLRRHLLLGREVHKPVILHCRSKLGQRDAQDDLLHELADMGAGTTWWRTTGSVPALLHSFSGPVDYAERALEMGLAISFSGLVFRAGEEVSAEVARLVPDDRLLVETDSPYLSPPGAPRRRNEPRYVSVTAAWLAEQRGADPVALGDTLVANYDRVFNRARNSSRPPASSR